MNGIRIASCLVVAALGVMAQASTAAANPTTVSCATAFDDYFTSTQADWLNIVGTRVTARGGFGFSSFSMQDGYQVATNPLHTAPAATKSVFTAVKGSSHFAGPFHEVYPGRGNSDVDRTDFWVYRTGALYLRSITWNGAWRQLQNMICYRGPQNQVVVTGHLFSSTHGTDFWTFVMHPSYLW